MQIKGTTSSTSNFGANSVVAALLVEARKDLGGENYLNDLQYSMLGSAYNGLGVNR